MTRARVLQEVRQMRFEELYERRQRRELTMVEAAEILGVTERTFRRWSTRYKTDGVAGLEDQRLGRASARAVPVDEVLQMVTLYESRYTGWTVKHFHERWQQKHGGTRSYTWTKKKLHAAGQVARAPRRGAHRKKRPRKPLPGMMLHQDGSTHEWVPGCQWGLIVTLEDATNELYSAFFVEEEGTMSSFQGLREVMATKGLFSSLYVDCGSHYWYTSTGWRSGGQDAADAGASGLAAIGDHADCRLFAGSAWPVGVRLPYGARSAAQRAGVSRGHGHGGGESVSHRAISSRLQSAICGVSGGSRDRLRPMDWAEPRRDSLCARRTGRCQRQYPAVSRPEPPDSARLVSIPLCEDHGAGPRASGGHLGRVPWPPMLGALRRAGPAE
ncbi:MAG: helix-turn-helix domain-containing protein [Nitrospira sp.]|nr:helix-turn-helix domain-containing protein [Nitrospira sp.]